MSLFELGKPAKAEHAGMRDATHIPAICLVSHTRLLPGTEVGVSKDGISTSSDLSGVTGFVDPFRPGHVLKGEVCHVLLSPGSVENVRHEWDHPGITGSSRTVPSDMKIRLTKLIAEPDWDVFLAKCAKDMGIDVDTLNIAVDAAVEFNSADYQSGTYVDTGAVDWDHFWERWEKHHGKKTTFRGDPFCC